ncbi:MAG: glutamate racemase [Candidatus Zixiibacteriota bacterium]
MKMITTRKKSKSSQGNLNPIGIFDSGLGGLTVAKRIFELLPNENVVYFGDTARFPYGPRSKEIIRKFSFQDANFLLSQKVKFIVVACNTASSLALEPLRRRYQVPLIGVVEPGASAAAGATKNGKIGVIGTVGTIHSRAYQNAIRQLNSQLKVYSLPCPLFVSLAEEGYVNKRATRLISEEYLSPLVKKGVDTLVLGCTHYPLLKNVISKTMGGKVRLIDSADEVAKKVRDFLSQHQLLRTTDGKAFRMFYVSDVPDRFIEVGQRFLRAKIEKVKRIDIDKYW